MEDNECDPFPLLNADTLADIEHAEWEVGGGGVELKDSELARRVVEVENDDDTPEVKDEEWAEEVGEEGTAVGGDEEGVVCTEDDEACLEVSHCGQQIERIINSREMPN
jgi:hypothetical protein